MPDDPTGIEARSPTPNRPLVAVGIVLVLLYATGTFAPRAPYLDFSFGLEGYRHAGAAAFVPAAAALLLLLAVPGVADLLGRILAAAGAVLGRRAALLVPVGLGALFWLLPNRTLSGDAGSILFMAATREVHPSNPLVCYAFRVVEGATGLDPVLSIRLTSTLAGVLFAFAALALARECAPPGPRRTGVAAILLATGSVAIFFGTLEVYALPVAAMTLYLLFGIRWLGGKGRGVAPPLCLGLAFCLHGSAAALLPSLGILANRGRVLRVPPRRRILLWGAIGLIVPVLTFALLWFGHWQGEPPPPGARLYGTFLGAEGEGPFLPLLQTPFVVRQRYAILDPEHAIGILNLLLLAAPVGLALFLVGRRRWSDTRLRFAAAAAGCLFFIPNVWNVSYSLRRDWDLFSSMGPAIALLGAIVWSSRERTRAGAVRVAALSLFCTLPFVLSNSLRPREELAYSEDVASSLRKAVPVTAAIEAVREAERRAEAAELRVTAGERVRFERELRGIVAFAFEQTGAFRRRIRIEHERVRAALERLLRGSPVGPQSDWIAAILSEELTLARLEPSEWETASQARGILAFRTVDRALRRTDLRGALPETPSHLLLLDAVDEALASGPGLRFEHRTLTAGLWREGIVANVTALGERLGGGIDAAAWAGILSQAMLEVSDPIRARERGLRWFRQDRAADAFGARSAVLIYPGREAALARNRWLIRQEQLGPRRLTFAEGFARHGLERSPGDISWIYLLAGIVYLEGRAEESVGLYREAIRGAPLHFSPWYDLAVVMLRLGRKEEALELATRGVRISAWAGRCAEALATIADLRMERGETEIARSNAREALDFLERTGLPPEKRVLEKRLRRLLEGGGE